MATPRQHRIPEERLQQIRKAAEETAPAAVGENEPRHIVPSAEQPNYYGLPLLKRPPWAWEIPVYFFVGGAAGASSILAAAANRYRAAPEMVRDARWLAAIGGAISPVFLIADLGMPSRFLNMFRVLKFQSPMSVGSWTLMAFSSSAAALALLGEMEKRTARSIPILTTAAEATSVLSGAVLSTYTGVLIGATAVPVWNEHVSLLPVHFAASGLSAAVSILELRGHTTAPLNHLGLAAAALETATGSALEARSTPASNQLRTGSTGWMMRAAGVLAGPLPLALRLAALFVSNGRRKQLQKAAAVSAIAGSIATRVAWIEAGRKSADTTI